LPNLPTKLPNFEKAAPAQRVAQPARKPAKNLVTGAPAGTLFAGDTLFAGSIGRTDLWGGSLEDILRSIHQKLLALPDETAVFPGHGAATTIGEERERNPFLR
jgi:hypothetical protein